MISHINLYDAEQSFRFAMASHNIHPDQIIFNTSIPQRFACESDNGRNKSCAYRVWSDGIPSGWFQCWKCGIYETWSYKQKNKYRMNKIERDNYLQYMTKRKMEEAKLRKEAYAIASEEAKNIWEKAKPCISHQYLTLKKIKSHNWRVHTDGTLLIPCHNIFDDLVNLEKIYFDSRSYKFEKRPLKGGKRIGIFHLIGATNNPNNIIYISEGISTAATIFEATQQKSVAALSCGNLLAVAQAIRKKYPFAKIVFSADDDKWPPIDNTSRKNYGRIFSTIAANAVDGHIVLPNFNVLQLSNDELRKKKYTDFNDLYVELTHQGFNREAALRQVQLQLENL